MRLISLLLACLASFVGLVFPFVLGLTATGLNQSVLLVMMCAVAGAFIYGAGFKLRPWWAALLVSPAATWPVMAGCFAVLVMMR